MDNRNMNYNMGFGSIGKKPGEMNQNVNMNAGANMGQNAYMKNTGPNQNVNMNQPGNYTSYYNPNAANGNGQPVYTQQPGKQSKPKHKSMELSIGKNLMGVLASLLVFAGIVLFATAASEILNDTQKFIGIFAMSIIMFLVGRIGMVKKRNAFFLSLAGCGIGAIFISMFLAYGYFHLINVVILYVGLGIWSVLVSFLGGKDSTIFRVVGQSGVLVSLIFGTSQLAKGHYDSSPLLLSAVLILFYIWISYIYLTLDRKASKSANVLSLMLDIFATIFLNVAIINVSSDISLMVQVSLAVLVNIYSISLVNIFIRRLLDDEGTDGYHALWVFYVVISAVSTAICTTVMFTGKGENGWIRGTLGILFIFGLWFVVSTRKKRDIEEKICKSILFAIAVIFATYLGFVSEFVGIGIFVIPFAIISFIRRRKLYLTYAVISGFLFVFTPSDYIAVFAMLGLIFMLVIVAVLALRKEVYSGGYKVAVFGMLQIFMIRVGVLALDNLDLRLLHVYSFVCVTAIVMGVLVMLAGFNKNWVGGMKEEPAMTIMIGVTSSLWAFLLLISLFAHKNTVLHAVVVGAIALSLTTNIILSLKRFKDNAFIVIYNDIKFTLFLVIALASYQAEGYFVSCVCVIVAIIAIILGFIMKNAGTRIYGLVLSIIGILKLVLFDITFDSNMSRAIVVLVCGIIAFAICFLYSMLDKKLKDDGQENTPAFATNNAGQANAQAQMASNENMPNQPAPSVQPEVNKEMQNEEVVTEEVVAEEVFAEESAVMEETVATEEVDVVEENVAIETAATEEQPVIQLEKNETESPIDDAEKVMVAENVEVLDNVNIETQDSEKDNNV